MPIEINELTVRARVRDEEQRNAAHSNAESTESGGGKQSDAAADLRRTAEIATEIIKRQKER